MTRMAFTLATGLLLGGLGLGTVAATAAPALPQPGFVAGDSVDTVAYRRHYRHHSTKAERMMRRRNTMRHGNPNARNPAQSGIQQQLGNTTGGPRY